MLHRPTRACLFALVGGASLFAGLFAGACRPGGAEPLPAKSNVLLITVDTLRADHLSSYGYPRPTSPAIDRLAAEGVRFAAAAVQWPKTTPSFTSIFTSTYGKDNGNVRQVGMPVPCRFETLAEALRRAGYSTHAVVANAALASDFGMAQGFDSYLETWKLPPAADGGDPNRAESVTRLATVALDRLDRRRPFFLWVHYLDPHWPYRPPGKRGRRFLRDAHYDPAIRIPIAREKRRREMMAIGAGQVENGHDELAFYLARYDAEIAYADEQIGRLLQAARAKGLLRRTLTVFTADHGESIGDHGYYFDHGRFGFQSCLRVPLVLHYPGVLEPRVDAEPAELLDLAPTFLEMAGVELPGGVWKQGRSLTPRLRGVAPRPGEAGADDGLAFSEAGYEVDNKWQKIVRDRRFKLIFAQTEGDQRWIGGRGVRFALFDLENDPGETTNVARRFPRDLERLKRALWRWERAPRYPVESEPPSAECKGGVRMESETEDLLRSLGYIR